jgi:predicted metal-dependent hydrolase
MTERKVPTRRMDFEPSFADVPRHFAGDGDLISSHLTAALSSVFPDGEDFFVRSVRHYRDRVDDPALKRDVAGFIGQEAVHGPSASPGPTCRPGSACSRRRATSP